MSVPVIYDAYGEDGDFNYYGGQVLSSPEANGFYIFTTPGSQYNSSRVRESVGVAGTQYTFMTRLWLTGLRNTFWFHAAVYMAPGNAFGSGQQFFAFTDGNSTDVIMFSFASGQAYQNEGFTVSAIVGGVQTTLGETLSGFTNSATEPDALDVYVNYIAGSGAQIIIYINKFQVFTYTGVLLASSGATLGGTSHRSWLSGGNVYTTWSECFLSDSITLDMLFFTIVPYAIGTLDQWTGELSNIDQPIVNDGAFDSTNTANQIQRYKAGGIPAGNYQIAAKVINIRTTRGTSVLTRIATAQLLNGGNSEISSPDPLPTYFNRLQWIDAVNPYTGVQWTQSDLSDPTREVGYESES